MSAFREQDEQHLVVTLQNLCDMLSKGPSADDSLETWKKMLLDHADTARIQSQEIIRRLENWKAGNLKLLSEKRTLSNEVQKLKDQIQRPVTRPTPLANVIVSNSSSTFGRAQTAGEMTPQNHESIGTNNEESPVVSVVDETMNHRARMEIDSVCAVIGVDCSSTSDLCAPLATSPSSSISRTGQWVRGELPIRSGSISSTMNHSSYGHVPNLNNTMHGFSDTRSCRSTISTATSRRHIRHHRDRRHQSDISGSRDRSPKQGSWNKSIRECVQLIHRACENFKSSFLTIQTVSFLHGFWVGCGVSYICMGKLKSAPLSGTFKMLVNRITGDPTDLDHPVRNNN